MAYERIRAPRNTTMVVMKFYQKIPAQHPPGRNTPPPFFGGSSCMQRGVCDYMTTTIRIQISRVIVVRNKLETLHRSTLGDWSKRNRWRFISIRKISYTQERATNGYFRTWGLLRGIMSLHHIEWGHPWNLNGNESSQKSLRPRSYRWHHDLIQYDEMNDVMIDVMNDVMNDVKNDVMM